MTVLDLMTMLAQCPLSAGVYCAGDSEYAASESLLRVEVWPKQGVFILHSQGVASVQRSRGWARDIPL